MAKTNPLRRGRFDDLGLRRALSDRLLPLLVAAMAFLAAMALAGAVAASSLAEHWRLGAGAALTVQVPQPAQTAAANAAEARTGETRGDIVLRLLRGTPGIAEARRLTDAELADMLRPWLGSSAESQSLPLPAVIAVRLARGVVPADLATRLTQSAPGTLVESHEIWMQQLSILAQSLQGCAIATMLVVVLVAAAVVATATRAGLATRRDAIEIIHGLGASDGYIARRFAGRITLLATAGAAIGTCTALPLLLALASLAAPFATWETGASSLADSLPRPIWLALPALPAGAALIGWLTAQGTVRAWLRRLP